MSNEVLTMGADGAVAFRGLNNRHFAKPMGREGWVCGDCLTVFPHTEAGCRHCHEPDKAARRTIVWPMHPELHCQRPHPSQRVHACLPRRRRPRKGGR